MASSAVPRRYSSAHRVFIAPPTLRNSVISSVALHDAPKQRDVCADGFAETLVRPEDDLLRLRPADGALSNPRVSITQAHAQPSQSSTL